MRPSALDLDQGVPLVGTLDDLSILLHEPKDAKYSKTVVAMWIFVGQRR